MHIFIKNKKLFLNHYKIKCSIGKRGIKVKKSEGDQITPKGKFKIISFLYRKDRIKKIQSKLRKIVIKKNMGWCNDRKSKDYNKLINLPFNYSYEELFRKENIYDIVLVLNYNMSPIKKNRGSAIFIHIAKKDYKKTQGCVAVKKITLLKILKEITIYTKVKIEDQR